MFETSRSVLNKGNKVGAIAMDLSKAFDKISLNLLSQKLIASIQML